MSSLRIKDRWLDSSVTKSSVVMSGCHLDSSLGENPYGRLDISEIQSQFSVRDSDNFEITIYKDYDLTQRIAVLEAGAILTAQNIVPGALQDLTITPSNYLIQAVNDITISFTTEHTLTENAGNLVELPYGMQIPDRSSPIEVQLKDGSIVYAQIVKDNTIQIPNVVPSGMTYPGGTQITYTIKNIKNQNSAKDAGSFIVITQEFVDGVYYAVDEQLSQTSFTATPGNINAVGDIVISDPTNSAKDVIYNLRFTMDHDLPPASYVRISIPPEVTLTPSTVLSTGSCKVYFCSSVTQT